MVKLTCNPINCIRSDLDNSYDGHDLVVVGESFGRFPCFITLFARNGFHLAGTALDAKSNPGRSEEVNRNKKGCGTCDAAAF
jgi:hypothetical protein